MSWNADLNAGHTSSVAAGALPTPELSRKSEEVLQITETKLVLKPFDSPGNFDETMGAKWLVLRIQFNESLA